MRVLIGILIFALLLFLLWRFVFLKGCCSSDRAYLDILKEAYKKGEISKEVYKQKKRELLRG